MNNSIKTQFDALKDFIKSRKVGFKNGVLFYLYFFLVIIILGGAGIWASLIIEVIKGEGLHQNIYLSIMTFSLPLMTAFAIDVIKMDVDKQIKTILQIVLFFSVIICAVVFTIFAFSQNNWAYLPASLFALLALFFWWMVNCENKNLYDEDYYSKNRESENKLEQALKNI